MPQYCRRDFMIIIVCLALVFNIFLVGPLVPTFASGVRGTMSITSQGDGLPLPSRCSSWNLIPGPTSSASIYSFLATSALSSNDIWAVGAAVNTSADHTNMTLTAHWDGNSWSVINSANRESNDVLLAVTALSSNDVWAVGSVEGEESFIEHWDGFSWSVVPTPVPGTYSSLSSVTAIAEDNVWAVGTYKRTVKSLPQTLTEHWNGRSWSIVPSPNLGYSGWLKKVIAVPGSHRLWAVGNAMTNFSTGGERTLIEYWNGTSWSIVSSPNQKPENNLTTNALTGVAALSANNIWAVGFYQSVSGSNTSPGHPLIEHWDGISWTMVSGPNLDGQNILYGITRVPQIRELWAVGGGLLNNNYQSFAESYTEMRRC